MIAKKQKEGGIIYVSEKLNIQTNAFSLLSQSSVQNILIPRLCGKKWANFQELTVHVVSYTFINEDPIEDTADKLINLLWCCASCYSVQMRFFLDIVLCLLLAGYHKMRLNIEAGCLHDYLSESLCAIFVHALHY